MAYLPTIPQATDKLSVSQPQLLGNFSAIDDGSSAGFAANHISLTAVSDVGKHKYVEFVNTSAPAVGAATQMTLYSATTDIYPHLYYKNSSFSFDMQSAIAGSSGGIGDVTFNMPNLFTGDGANWQMKSGATTSQSVVPGGNTTITYPVAFTTNSLAPIVTPIFTNADATHQVLCTVKSFTKSGFVVRIDSIGSSASGNTGIAYQVIGR